MGVSIVTIGGLIGIFITSSLAQWYYTKHYGSNGFPCLPTNYSLFSFDLGWKTSQLLEITQEIQDLTARTRTLQRELAEIRLTRIAIDRAKAMGEAGQERLKELKKMKNLRKSLSKRIVGGLGRRIHRAGTRIKSPLQTLIMGDRHSHEQHDIEQGEISTMHEHEHEHEENEEERELREREHEAQAELADLQAEKDLLEQLKISEGH
jgi:hypothetical protein